MTYFLSHSEALLVTLPLQLLSRGEQDITSFLHGICQPAMFVLMILAAGLLIFL